ncbi:DUF6959 family protein [Actinacidiphila alni]|uniref:DUF6959 family protein n=1 Tax=Actinacidiphila alni TaxID=380248 RepID=UPI0034546B6C
MERVEAELFTNGGNNAVLRLPGRTFPGVLVQGDSLHILRTAVAELSDLCEAGAVEEVRETAGLLLSDMDLLIERYTEALRLHGIRLPF